MSCCGQKRLQWQQRTKPSVPDPAPAQPVLENPVEIKYSGIKSHLVKGITTGYLYLFGEQQPNLMVDSRDAALLLQDTQKFSLISHSSVSA